MYLRAELCCKNIKDRKKPHIVSRGGSSVHYLKGAREPGLAWLNFLRWISFCFLIILYQTNVETCVRELSPADELMARRSTDDIMHVLEPPLFHFIAIYNKKLQHKQATNNTHNHSFADLTAASPFVRLHRQRQTRYLS